MKTIFAVMILSLSAVFNISQAQKLIWVKDNFNLPGTGLGNWAEWWGGYTSVTRVIDLPNAGDKSLACTFNKTGSSDLIATGIYSPAGYDINGSPDVADTLTMEVYFPSDFPLDSISRVTFVCQPQGGGWDDWYEVDFTPVLGAWNHLALNIDSLKGVSADYADLNLRIGPRIYTSGSASGVYYIDNITLHSVTGWCCMDLSPSITVNHQLYTGIYGQKRYANRIRWNDLYNNISESYNLYASRDSITDVKAGGVIALAKGISRNNQIYNHWIYSTYGSDQTWYYAITSTALDSAGIPWESLLDYGSVSGAITGPSTVPYIVQLDPFFSQYFVLDGDISEFKGSLDKYNPGVKIQPEWSFGNSSVTSFPTDAEVPVDTSHFNFEMYMIMDYDYLYIGQSVKDVDNIGADLSLSLGESAEFFWGFYDADTAKSWPGVPDTARWDYHFGCEWNALNRFEYAPPSIDGEVEANVDTITGTAVWEMKIPLTSIGSGFIPVSGMMMPFNLWVNTVNTERNDRGDVLIVGCADNSTDTSKDQWERFLPVNPERRTRPGTWGQVMISDIIIVAAGEEGQVPDRYGLSQCYPNPFNPATNIRYSLEKSGLVRLIVYDILGRQIRTLVNERQDAGVHTVSFNAGSLPSGVYFYQMKAGNFSQTKKLVLAR